MVKCFLDQTYSLNTELLILDETNNPWLPPLALENTKGFDRVRYYQIPPSSLSTGAKRNMINGMAGGDVLVHFDDDDWSHPERIADQLTLMRTSGAEVVGYHDLLYYRIADKSLWSYKYQGRPCVYATGTSQMYRKSWWAKHKFNLAQTGEDSQFSACAAKHKVLASVEGRKMVVARAHAGNTFHPAFGHVPFLAATREQFPVEFLQEVGLG